jgi:hypothetical protein
MKLTPDHERITDTVRRWAALARHGSAELRAEFLAPAISGAFVGCLGVSEVGAGSGVASIRTTAVTDGDDYDGHVDRRAATLSRNSLRFIFPVNVFGSASIKAISRGYL